MTWAQFSTPIIDIILVLPLLLSKGFAPKLEQLKNEPTNCKINLKTCSKFFNFLKQETRIIARKIAIFRTSISWINHLLGGEQ